MIGGFSFCGTDIADIGLHYAPELQDTYIYAPGETNIHDETFEGHNGGYFYGASKSPKTMVLRCYFEEKFIERGIMARVYNLFRTGKQGKLIFRRRPWCYYYATVVDCAPEYTNYMNGIIKITMKAYYPYARSDKLYCEKTDADFFNVMENTAMPEEGRMVPGTEICNISHHLQLTPGNPIRTVYLLNPGTERAQVGIYIQGSSESGFTITNENTNQTVKFVALDASKQIYFDGMNGKTVVKGDTDIINMMYHDSGSIELEPSYPAVRNLYLREPISNGVAKFASPLYDPANPQYDTYSHEGIESIRDLYVGRYLFANANWWPILDIQNISTLTVGSALPGNHVNSAFAADTKPKAFVATLNKLTIRSIVNTDLSKLTFTYKATFA